MAGRVRGGEGRGAEQTSPASTSEIATVEAEQLTGHLPGHHEPRPPPRSPPRSPALLCCRLVRTFLSQHLPHIPHYTGLPSYNSDTYYDDYNEEEYDDDGDYGLDLDQENLEEMGRMAKMKTVGETFKVDAGTTIRLPCQIDNLHGRSR